MKPIVIGKYANPRCLNFEEYQQGWSLVWILYNQKKAWMTSNLLHKIFSKLNRFFRARNRSILLFLDSAGCHPYDLKGRYSNKTQWYHYRDSRVTVMMKVMLVKTTMEVLQQAGWRAAEKFLKSKFTCTCKRVFSACKRVFSASENAVSER